MSGGFFRGTSADQDTRFSNKQAKLMKSQKFAAELEHLVDMTKVKMDVVKPWIATRVTELLGFEDEVLINFIYGLLDRKAVNGKEVQIQLTGFMEKNTGKFMKELWTLLLSAQKNASGIPQQFLDAKEEETRKKKEETDRITNEILKKKEKEKEERELEQEKLRKMDDEIANAVSDPVSKHSMPRASRGLIEEEKEANERNGTGGKNRISRSPHSADRSPSSHRSTRSRSISKPLSNSRSYSGERHKSRSLSRSPQPHGRSTSPDSSYRSPRRRSISTRLRHSPRRPRSPLRRSPHSRRRSPSNPRRRSPSPVRRRLPSPSRRRSPFPLRRRSPSPFRRRSPSPVRRRSPPPMRRRSPSPLWRRSPSPVRRRSPIHVRRRSPSPSRRRSPSPLRWRSPSPPRRRSPSPVRRRSPVPRSPKRRRRSPMQSPRRRIGTRSPYKSRSPAHRLRRSLSRDRDIRTNGAESRRYRDDYASQRIRGKISPVRRAPERMEIERPGQGHKGPDSLSRQLPISLRSPQRDPRDRSDTLQKRIVRSSSPEKSLSPSESSPCARKMSSIENRSPSESPVRQQRERITRDVSRSPVRQLRERVTRHDSPETSREEKEPSDGREEGRQRIDFSRRTRYSPPVGGPKGSHTGDLHRGGYSPDGLTGRQSTEPQGRPDNIVLRKRDQERKSAKAPIKKDPPERLIQQTSHALEEIEYGPGDIKGRNFSLDVVHDEQPSAKQLKRDSPSNEKENYKAYEKRRSHSRNYEGSGQGHKKGAVQKSMKNVDRNDRIGAFDSDSEENEMRRSEDMVKRKHKRQDKHDMGSDDDAGYDSQIDEKKAAKKRKKEDKRLRKEDRRRRREERHRRREERRAGKLKTKIVDTVTPPSDFEKNRNDTDDSDGDVAVGKESHPSDTEETESEQKKLEIELRKKALESLRAKKGINH